MCPGDVDRHERAASRDRCTPGLEHGGLRDPRCPHLRAGPVGRQHADQERAETHQGHCDQERVFAADEIADAIDAVIETYKRERRAGERFIDALLERPSGVPVPDDAAASIVPAAAKLWSAAQRPKS